MFACVYEWLRCVSDQEQIRHHSVDTAAQYSAVASASQTELGRCRALSPGQRRDSQRSHLFSDRQHLTTLQPHITVQNINQLLKH